MKHKFCIEEDKCKCGLNIGCGKEYLEGWTNIDIDASVKADLYCDISQGLPYPDNTFDEVLLSHVLEHMREPLKLLAEIRRVCKPGAKAVIHVPHWSNFTAFGTLYHEHYYSHLIYRDFIGFKLKKIRFNCYRRNKKFIMRIIAPVINLITNAWFTLTELLISRILPVSEIIFTLEVEK